VILAIVVAITVLGPVLGLAAILSGGSPIRYVISGGTLVVQSGSLLSGDRKVPLADITESRAVALNGARRTAGTALPGYCVGRFSYPDLGAVWQATNCARRGLLVTARGEERPLVISPPDAEGFLASLRAGTETTVTLPPPDTGPLFLIAVITIPIGILVAIMVGALMLLGPSRMVYRVGEGAFEVRTLFGRQRWPTAGARAKGHTPGRLWRVAGSGMPGYYTGRFREGGEGVRVYATDLTRVILFEGPDRVMVSPEDPAGFLEALRAEGVEVERP
jgi:hypothetical protein